MAFPTASPCALLNMTYVICLAIGFVAGIYREKLSEKAREIYVKITERK